MSLIHTYKRSHGEQASAIRGKITSKGATINDVFLKKNILGGNEMIKWKLIGNSKNLNL